MVTASRSALSGMSSCLLRHGDGSVSYLIQFPKSCRCLASSTLKLIRNELDGKPFAGHILSEDFSVGSWEMTSVTISVNGWDILDSSAKDAVRLHIEHTAEKINGMYGLKK